jgi:REP element-mobilizing transposase RayT
VLYYVTSRSGHGQNLFIDHSDYQEYLSLIEKYKQQYGFKLFAYVLLPTHLHLLIELKNKVPISNIMHDINSLYTKIFNGRYNKKGHLFQERFRTTLAEKESYLLPLTRHIHLNSIREHVGSRPQDYPYSSYLQFLYPEKRQHPNIAEEIEEVFTLLGGREAMFSEYVINADQKQMNELKRSLHKKRILGSKVFVEQTRKIIDEAVRQLKTPSRTKRVYLMYMTVSGIVVVVSAVTIVFFYRQHSALRSEYDQTMRVYEKTLVLLRSERDKALKANQDIAEYIWKIRLTEKALEDLKREREKALKLEKEIEGYEWKIRLIQIGGPRLKYNPSDTIIIKGNLMSSANMQKAGFANSRYSKRELKNGKVVWETIQTNARGEKVSWRGEWDGKLMRGVFSWQGNDGVVRDFSFVSVGERTKR